MQLKNLLAKVLRYLPQILLVTVALIHFVVALRMNWASYDNFDFGKFDLGNMTQMVWNTLHGRFMYLTDYFGTNLPRWAMSHVDPILLIFVPIFALFPSPMTLVISQLLLVISSAFILYLISDLKFKNKWAASFVGISFLLYPAIGYLNTRTSFHGVSAAIPFFLLAFYIFERGYINNDMTLKKWILFWLLVVITMSGKEQIPLYIVMWGIFIAIFRQKQLKTGVALVISGILWFLMAFVVIIPSNAHYRVDGYVKFTESLGLSDASTRDVALPNYFLNRYEAFGDSYTDVVISSLLDHKLAIKVFFGGDKPDNLIKTFMPLGFLPLAFPQLLLLSAPDFFINYMTTAGGIGTSEIYNHRVSMIIPVLFLAAIYALHYLGSLLESLFARIGLRKIKLGKILVALSFLLVIMNLYTSYIFNNPVYLWLNQAVVRRVFAKSDVEIFNKQLKIGDVVSLSELDNKDRECAEKIVQNIPDTASISGPDYLGAHLSMRETYAIFPALYNQADYVIVDVFSQKILNILDVESDLVKDVVRNLLTSPYYSLEYGCGNMFVFKKAPNRQILDLLPIQEKNNYEVSIEPKLEMFMGLEIADFELPQTLSRGEHGTAKIVYYRGSSKSLDDYIMFNSLVNTKTGDIYQAANLPSFALKQPEDWEFKKYYIEYLDITPPTFLEPGTYKYLVGMGNKVRTRSIYLGDITIN
ncbi:hypothetical protein A3K34_03115 [candidate division WWE3 bacterium RIFOXYC1_FULL_40_10]|uniref:Glycosyltransferase RgtA/B/C/D-like domain-containing protein n=1 Tax=candidate division WWE3 bacterium RIFOXYA2_FULL_46_9 TaxID=1802636 RepID=A0A1F4W0B2_UNCKA|nr:MAG: hypothetical protein A3K58_03115 [candidate division WWE3 bacterium RIFOXYB1_FULL_40_22]OGC61838.1 MAG: hypothetical protein A3K37_03115 [candidate division WWE3 bacterium RIFOXYA1_FULL_40_11]OGC62854.1 MAG: hypothetical protein A2264_04280 [candidate division WWE3 bacterium RIFOXYA2_FULL_46_9]OGC64310.1 MAG: hypothetical protein A2326_00530 [candidate division WWE3 bacterium RIFOXYB2_FULL_41_6]OGC66221.1 MAG: hypothetical protein A3K34_03115 [candidate division WWE3 bacterium RIFOXYC1_